MQADCQHAKITKPQKQDGVFLSEYDKTAEKWENKNPEIAQISRMLVCRSGFGRFCHVFHLPCGQKKACQAAEKKPKDGQQTKQRKFPLLIDACFGCCFYDDIGKDRCFCCPERKKTGKQRDAEQKCSHTWKNDR